MKPVNGLIKIAAAATALSITFALVYSMANLGYPGIEEFRVPLLAAVAN
jgi:hypothetical protein